MRSSSANSALWNFSNSLIRIFSLACLLICLTGATQAHAQSTLDTPFSNLDQMAQNLGLNGFRVQPRAPQRVKVAILDNGFKGYQAEIGKTLPQNTQYHAGPIAVDPQTEEAHGLFMAQIMAGLLDRAGHGTLPVEIHLYSAYGYSNLQAAVEQVVAQKFDVVLYSQVWEYGGNGDGHGFINTLVSQATAAGAIWVNAAGNFGDATYTAPVDRVADDWAALPGPNNGVRVRCMGHDKGEAEPPLASGQTPDHCQLRAVLSWNDFNDDVSVGTDKDLDLILTDDTLKVVQSSGLVQKKVVDPNQPGESLYPREILEADIPEGLYYLRVKIRSNNFDKDRDVLRITTSGDFIQQQDVSNSGETLLPPADNPTVITIGATDSIKSSMGRAERKPELSFASAVKLKNGETYKGTSNSAAIAAAGVVILKAYHPDLDRRSAIRLLNGGLKPEAGTGGGVAGGTPTGNSNGRPGQGNNQGQGSNPGTGRPGGSSNPNGNQGYPQPTGGGLPLAALGFGPTGAGCFVPTQLPLQTPAVIQLLQRGAIGVMTTTGPKIFTATDPFAYLPGVARLRFDDILVVGYNGFSLLPRAQENGVSSFGLEVTQLPADAVICGMGGSQNQQGATTDPNQYGNRSGYGGSANGDQNADSGLSLISGAGMALPHGYASPRQAQIPPRH